LTLPEAGKNELIERIQSLDFTYNGWDPQIEVWRAGEAHERNLPYISVDFIQTSQKLFGSMSDIVGRIDDRRYEYAFCELEFVNISVYANKYHNNDAIRGRDFAFFAINEIRNDVLAWWNDILYKYDASIDRRIEIPIKDLTIYYEDVATRVHEFELDFYLRTDVRWYRELPSGEEGEVRAEQAYIIMNDKNNIRINTS